jgi:hypothetical protein
VQSSDESMKSSSDNESMRSVNKHSHCCVNVDSLQKEDAESVKSAHSFSDDFQVLDKPDESEFVSDKLLEPIDGKYFKLQRFYNFPSLVRGKLPFKVERK